MKDKPKTKTLKRQVRSSRKMYIVYNVEGEILRTGVCSKKDLLKQAEDGEFIMEGTANDLTQKVVNGKVVNKTPEEIKSENPAIPKRPKSQRPADITNKQWQGVLDRLKKLEADKVE